METLTPGQNFLAEEIAQIEYEYASTGQRFANLLIDSIIITIFNTFVTSAAAGIIIALISPEMINQIAQEPQSFGVLFLNFLLSYLSYFICYFLMEKLMNGKTIGKFITGTKAMNEDGTPMSTNTLLRRTLWRLVPFEAFSGFGGHPWHDTRTNTMVVKTR